MSTAYLVFRTYGASHRVVFLAACSSEESAKKFCLEKWALKRKTRNLHNQSSCFVMFRNENCDRKSSSY